MAEKPHKTPWNKGKRKVEAEKFPEAGEVERLLRVARGRGARDFMVLFLASHLGLRSIEVVNLCRRDFDLAGGSVVIHTAKQKSEAPTLDRIPVLPQVAARVGEYLKGLPTGQEYLFAGQASGKHLTTRAARGIFEACAKAAKVRPTLSMHSLRHHAGLVMWEITKDIKKVAKLLRHRSEKNAWKYVHTTYDDLKTALERFPVIGLG